MIYKGNTYNMSTVKSYNEYVKSSSTNEEAEGGMYRLKLEQIIKDAQEIVSMMNDNDDLEAWVQDKITIAHHNMEAIKGYLKTGENPKTGINKPLFDS